MFHITSVLRLKLIEMIIFLNAKAICVSSVKSSVSVRDGARKCVCVCVCVGGGGGGGHSRARERVGGLMCCCVCACVRACVRACVCVCVTDSEYSSDSP